MSPMRQLKVLEPVDFDRLLAWLDPDPIELVSFTKACAGVSSRFWRRADVTFPKSWPTMSSTVRPAREGHRSDLHR